MKTFFLICVALTITLLCSSTVMAQCAKFLPPAGKCMLVVGQDLDAVGGGAAGNVSGYIDQVLDDTNRDDLFPAGITVYTDGTYNLGLDNFSDLGLGIPQHALSYVSDQTFENCIISIGMDLQGGQLAGIASGQLDGSVGNLAGWVQRANRPVFLRIGYEFDGPHNQYNPTTYITAFRRVVSIFNNANVTNCAFVWQSNSSEEGSYSNYSIEQYYPGDEYVDWCAFSRFWGNSEDMISFARSHGKPVMIAEATPKGQHTDTDGLALWNSWYQQVINLVKDNNDVIRILCYINQDWDQQPVWQNTFGDSRIQAHSGIQANWISEISEPFWIHAHDNLFADLNNPDCPATADFESDVTRIYLNESVTLEDRSLGVIHSWLWQFGSGASTAMSNTEGPHTIHYATTGLKTITLSVGDGSATDTKVKTAYILVEEEPAGCILADELTSAYSVGTFVSDANAWTHVYSGGAWVITSAKGHDEWAYFSYLLNNGTDVETKNLTHNSGKPVVTVRARKKPAGTSNADALLRMDLVDRFDVPTDAVAVDYFPLTTEWQEFTVDLSKYMTNHYGCGGEPGCGDLDVRHISRIQFSVNRGFASFPSTYQGVTYDEHFVGDVEIDYLYLGQGCDESVRASFDVSALSVAPGETVTFTDASVGAITAYAWNFGQDASVVTATTAGPHTISWSTEGQKTITLSVNGGEDIHTTMVNVTSVGPCAAFFDDYTSNPAEPLAEGWSYQTGTQSPTSAFTFSQQNGVLEINSAAGHAEWDLVKLLVNNNDVAVPAQISEENPVVQLKVKASVPMTLRVSLMDEDGSIAQTNELLGAMDFHIGTSWQEIEVDFSGELWDEWTSTGSIHDEKGHHDAVAAILLRPNNGYASAFPVLGASEAFTGSLYVDYAAFDVAGGVMSSCLTVGMKEEENGILPVVYPNPAHESFTIRTNGIAVRQVILYDAWGRIVTHIQSNQQNQVFDVDISKLPPGLYTLRINSSHDSLCKQMVKW